MKKFNKILLTSLLSLVTIFTFGCDKIGNTPTKKVEELMGKYQSIDEDVTNNMEDVIDLENNLTDTQKDRYRELLKKQYSNLTYEIKDEKIDGDNATVEVEIEVYDLSKATSEAEDKLANNPEEFNDEKGSYNDELYTDYKLDRMEKAKDRTKYTLDLTLTKEDGEWEVDNLTEIERDKIHGIYNE